MEVWEDAALEAEEESVWETLLAEEEALAAADDGRELLLGVLLGLAGFEVSGQLEETDSLELAELEAADAEDVLAAFEEVDLEAGRTSVQEEVLVWAAAELATDAAGCSADCERAVPPAIRLASKDARIANSLKCMVVVSFSKFSAGYKYVIFFAIMLPLEGKASNAQILEGCFVQASTSVSK